LRPRRTRPAALAGLFFGANAFLGENVDLRRGTCAPLDHDEIELNQSNFMNVIDSIIERDEREKPVPTFLRPALAVSFQ
jgi:hypothetical protein